MIHFTKPSEVIERIRDTIVRATPDMDFPDDFVTYDQRVLGAADLTTITEENVHMMESPSCFVLLAEGSSIINSIMNLDENMFHGFDIAVVLDTVDRRQQTAEESSVWFKDLFTYCLNGWIPPSAGTSGSPLQYLTDYTAFSNRSKYVRVYSFVQDFKFLARQDGLGDLPEDYDLQNFESFFADLYATETGLDGPAVEMSVTDMYDEE